MRRNFIVFRRKYKYWRNSADDRPYAIRQPLEMHYLVSFNEFGRDAQAQAVIGKFDTWITVKS